MRRPRLNWQASVNGLSTQLDHILGNTSIGDHAQQGRYYILTFRGMGYIVRYKVLHEDLPIHGFCPADARKRRDYSLGDQASDQWSLGLE